MLRSSPGVEELYLRQHEDSDWIDDPPPNSGPEFDARSLRKLRLQNFSTVAIACILSTMHLQPNGVAINTSGTMMDVSTLPQILPLFPPESSLSSAESSRSITEADGLLGSCIVVPDVR